LLVVIVSAFFAVASAAPPLHFGESRIFGGEKATLGQFPYQAGISFHRGDKYMWCGGSIIDKRWILTAAHCVHEVDIDVDVYVGIINKAFIFGGQQFHISSASDLIHHADYNSSMIRNDIGLIRLPEDIEYNDDVQPIKLVSRDHADDQFVGRASVASGWGKLHDSDELVADDLHFADLTPISNEECKKTFGEYLTDNNICVDAVGKSVCSGDSGGPLVTLDTHEQIGINSFVSGCGCECGEPAAMVRVSNFLDWIKEQSGLDV
ncbi:hypothetical protein ACFFRR_006998, partial [Megaselia abdita]